MGSHLLLEVCSWKRWTHRVRETAREDLQSCSGAHGGKVWYTQLGDAGYRRNKAETEWFQGIWLGPATGSSETPIGTTKGVVKASSIKRIGMTERWDVNAIIDMKGTPQRPDPNKPGLHIPVKIRVEP